MTHWLSSSLELCILLAGLGVWLLNGISLAEILWPDALNGLKIGAIVFTWTTLLRAAKALGIFALGMVIGVPIGRTIEDHYRDSNLKEREHVTIVQKDSARVYRMFDMKGGHYQAVFCEDHDFEPGEHLALLKYVDTGQCWKLSDKRSGFKYAKGETEHGWNTNADSNTYARSNSIPNP